MSDWRTLNYFNVEETMKAEDEIHFVGMLLDLIHELQELVRDHCKLLTANDDGHSLEKNDPGKYLF